MEVSPEFSSKLGAVLGNRVGAGAKVLVSKDSDRSSQMTSRAFICGLLSAGVDVIEAGILPIPVVRHTIRHDEELKAAIHVRKSPYDFRLQDIIFINALARSSLVRSQAS